MKIKSIFSAVILTAVLFISSNVFALLSGGGTQVNPYLIQSRADFDEFANPANASRYWASGVYTELICNLDLTGTTYTQAVIAPDTSTASGFQGTKFTGIFDGNGHTISNLAINQPTKDYIGFIGTAGTGGQVKNLGVLNVNLSGHYYVGGLVGDNYSELTSCHATGSVSGDSSVGGLVGYNSGTLTVCYSTSSVSGDSYVGGLVGRNWSGQLKLTACYATGSVTGTGQYAYVGGLAGDNYGSLTACYSTGLVTGTGSAAVGGLVGYYYSGTLTACFWDTQSSGQVTSAGGTGKTTVEMMTLTTFTDAGWDFEGESTNGTDDIWTMPPDSYPILLWQISGSLKVLILPQEAIDTGAQWRRVGTSIWLESGFENNVPDGSYIAEFKDMPCWSKPDDVPVTINANQLTELTVTYIYVYGGGSGTRDDPYQIWTPEQMNSIGKNPGDWGSYFMLMDDIDMSIYTGTQYNIVGNETTKFTGFFDGKGLKIYNLTFSTTDVVNHVGVFGYTENATIQNLGVENVLISSGGNCVGGLVGYSDSGLITSCYATGSISGVNTLGGLVGYNSGTLTVCYSTSSVSGSSYVGGLVGGTSYAMLAACYASGSVSGSSYVGGLVGGTSYPAMLAACYASGLVSGSSYVGGLVGYTSHGLATACFWDIETSGQSVSAGGTGKTTIQMMTPSTFTSAGWDFVGESANGLHDYWQMEANDYPRLTVHEWTLEGNGTVDNPYIVANGIDLGKVWLRPMACYRLSGNLDLSGTSWSTAVVPEFSGIFDGQGFVISNLTVNLPGVKNVGLFGRIDNGGKVLNLGLENVNITGDSFIGGLVGYIDSGSITSCYVTGSVNGVKGIGGLIGLSEAGNIINSYFAGTATVNGGGFAGGLVGSNYLGTVSNCYSTGTVINLGIGNDSVGGLVGENSGSSVLNCYSTSTVIGDFDTGGLVGMNWGGSISNCYATGAVSGLGCVGGLVGTNFDWVPSLGGHIFNCYATGSVSGTSYVGGLVGVNEGSAHISNSFWDIQTSGTTGVSNNLGTITNVFGLTTAQMQTLSNFTNAGWDFVGENVNGLNDYWQMEENDYPRLTVHEWTLAGDGTVENPYIVANGVDLGKVWLRPTACYRLGGNLDLSGISWSTAVIPEFFGIFDGQGFVISNLTINQPLLMNIGFFGNIKVGGQILNLGLENVDLNGLFLVGGMTGLNEGEIVSCYASGSVSGGHTLGGLAGLNHTGSIISCYTGGVVTGTTQNSSHFVGGLVGKNDSGSIRICYATGSVNGNSNVGGLVGDNYNGTIITSCYAVGPVTGTGMIGGLVGVGSETITACFWDTQTSGQTASGGGTGKTTAEMMTLSTFTSAGWDFSDGDGDAADWMMPREDEDYPRLVWQEIFAGDIAGLYGVNLDDYAEIAAHWNQTGCPAGCENADTNNDGIVDDDDLMSLADDWLSGL